MTERNSQYMTRVVILPSLPDRIFVEGPDQTLKAMSVSDFIAYNVEKFRRESNQK